MTKKVEYQETVTNMATGFEGTAESACKSSNRVISMCIVPVNLHHKSDPNNVIKVYAMLDNCSEGTFMTDEVAKMLTASVRRTTITIKTLNGQVTEEVASIPDHSQ